MRITHKILCRIFTNHSWKCVATFLCMAMCCASASALLSSCISNASLVDTANAGAIATSTTTTAPPWFNSEKTALLLWIVFIGAAVTVSVWLAKSGRPIRIRRIAALEAVDNAVGRATEMGRSILFVPGIQDMDNIQTVAGLTMLGRVAKTAADYDATIEVPTCRSLVMEAARDTVRASYLSAGRADGFSADRITYITDDQFGYVAHVVGNMVREKPATCFYMGCFFAESLIFAETGNAIGAIQIAGTAESSQLPFFVAACDYTLIGEEFFAASAYLSGEPAQLGTLRGQDIGKFAVGVLIVLGALASTILVVAPNSAAVVWFLECLQETLKS